jgi:hypothetical protein
MGCNCGKSKKHDGTLSISDPKTRMWLCKVCPYSIDTPVIGLTCGKLLKPEYDENGKQLTCGCILTLKTKLKKTRCPQGKW